MNNEHISQDAEAGKDYLAKTTKAAFKPIAMI